jgi:oxygen-independent coproporphyrinogen-3 oxidase
LRKCPYCDFTSFERPREEIDHWGYAAAVSAELGARAQTLRDKALRSVYFGGGTPSLWDPAALGSVVARILALSHADADLEVTVECNPSSLDRARAEALVAAGANRLSIGVQGLDAERLAFLGRLHDARAGLAAVEAAIEAGAARVSADLIYGVAPSAGRWQSPDEAAEEARRVIELGVGHVSAYALTIEPTTRFGELQRKRRLPVVSDDHMAECFLAVRETLEAAGLGHYEISSFALPGQESRHNLGYWRGDDYLGLGCAAWGTVSLPNGRALRYRNPPVPDRYLEQAATGAFEPHESEELEPETRLREQIMLGLRTRQGIALEEAAAALGVDPWPPHRRREADRLAREGRLHVERGTLRIPPRAWLFADGIASSLF